MSNISSESHRLGLVPFNIDSMTNEELMKFIETLDPDMMGFDGSEDHSDFECPMVATAAKSGISIGGGLTLVDNITSINFSNRWNPKKYLVVHYTAGTVDNGTAARANTEYFKSGYRGASAHFFVDCNPVVYRCVSEDLVAWHCGANKYYHSDCRNSNAIGVEICSYMQNGVYKFKDATYKNALNLCKWIVKTYNIPKERVIMHYHVTHKVCAAPFMSNSVPTTAWDTFKNAIFSDADVKPEPIVVDPLNSLGRVVNVGNDVLNVRKGPGTNYDIVGKYKDGDSVNIIGKSGDWYKLDTNNFVHSNYIQLYHWADEFRDNLLNKKIITDKDQWSRYSEAITKGLAVQIISNVYGDEKSGTETEHWAENAVKNLVSHGIITDPSQWSADTLNVPISKALFMALVCNATGGVSDIYKDRNPDHWGRNSLDTLCDRGIINTPASWTDFEAQVQKDICIAMISKAMNQFK